MESAITTPRKRNCIGPTGRPVAELQVKGREYPTTPLRNKIKVIEQGIKIEQSLIAGDPLDSWRK